MILGNRQLRRTELLFCNLAVLKCLLFGPCFTFTPIFVFSVFLYFPSATIWCLFLTWIELVMKKWIPNSH